MKTEQAIARLHWPSIEDQLDQEGHAILPGLLSERVANDLAALIGSARIDHKVSLASAELGNGELFFLSQALPPLVTELRTFFYEHLTPVANRWSELFNVSHRFPDSLDAFLVQNRKAGQTRPQSHLSRLRKEDYQALHQRSDSELVFPLQLTALLSEPGEEFTGGEFVMTEQRPRMQSRPIVLPMRKGDIAIFAVAQRPHKGAKGYYHVNLKHAVSRVRSGERIAFELLLHDARQG